MEVIFFFASAASSSAYLTASEILPLETRALAIPIFYAAGTAIGGLAAAVMELRFGIDAEGRVLEQIADPLSGCPASMALLARQWPRATRNPAIKHCIN